MPLAPSVSQTPMDNTELDAYAAAGGVDMADITPDGQALAADTVYEMNAKFKLGPLMRIALWAINKGRTLVNAANGWLQLDGGGKVPDALLSANVAMLNAANTFGSNGTPLNQTMIIAAGANGFKIREGFAGGPYDRFSVSLTAGHITEVRTDGSYYGANMILSGSAQFNGGITLYNNLFTAGLGVPAIFARGRVTGQVAAAAAIATFTPAADGTFEICGNVLVTTVGTINATMTCTYTDESNTARTLTLPFTLLAGTQTTAINAAVPYHGVPVKIRAKAATAITIQTVGVFTGAPVYNAEADIKQVA